MTETKAAQKPTSKALDQTAGVNALKRITLQVLLLISKQDSLQVDNLLKNLKFLATIMVLQVCTSNNQLPMVKRRRTCRDVRRWGGWVHRRHRLTLSQCMVSACLGISGRRSRVRRRRDSWLRWMALRRWHWMWRLSRTLCRCVRTLVCLVTAFTMRRLFCRMD